MSSETCQIEKADAVPVATALLHRESLLAELQALNPAALKQWEARWSSCRFRGGLRDLMIIPWPWVSQLHWVPRAVDSLPAGQAREQIV